MKAYFARLLDHAHWADARTLAALQGGDPPVEAVRLFAHVLTTEQIYHGRISGLDPWPQDFWPELSLTACASLVSINQDRYRRFLDEHSDEGLRRHVRYRNSQGVVYHTLIADMLTHLMLHGEHHRGQIAQALRQSGSQPPVTDFIAFVRERDG